MIFRLFLTDKWLYDNGAVFKEARYPSYYGKRFGWEKKRFVTNMKVQKFEITNKKTGRKYTSENLKELLEFLHQCKEEAMKGEMKQKHFYEVLVEAGFEDIKDIEDKRRTYCINYPHVDFSNYRFSNHYLISDDDILQETPEMIALLFLLNDYEILYTENKYYKECKISKDLQLEQKVFEHDGATLKYWSIKTKYNEGDPFFFARPHDINNFLSKDITFWYQRNAFIEKISGGRLHKQFLPHGMFTLITNFHGFSAYKFDMQGFFYLVQCRKWYKVKTRAIQIAKKIWGYDVLNKDIMNKINKLSAILMFVEGKK